ncbi:SMR domain-containing protein At5g58720-like isoform X2 [Durio zibethinus]|uniref:SMR domain-containing protein At5g58720-like isoform X2 n=1 Tax=Durio zibethinus TaxID=66656 RepID=A0A6P5ZTZ9_DURZI|nr:SMR domain-containing protein At5g58720-like isoform X2 [Durio zibethinus]
MKHTATKKKKKKKRSRAKKTPAVNDSSRGTSGQQDLRREEEDNEEQKKSLNSLMKAFCSISLEQATSAYNQAKGVLDKVAEMLSNLIDNDNESEDPEPSTSSISSGSSSSGSSGSDFAETVCTQNPNSLRGRCRGGKQQKRVVAAIGTVSTVLGKEYVKARPRRDSAAEAAARSVLVKEEAEQFLFSMLGDESELGVAVVRDVLCQCGYNVEKALDALLDLSASFYEQSKKYNDNVNNRQDTGFLSEFADHLTDRAPDCMSNSSESELQDSIGSVGFGCRSNVLNLPQEVLDSLFNIPKSSKQKPSTMHWRNVVKKLQSLGPGIDVCTSSVAEPQQDIYAKGDEYHEFRMTAKEHWDSMRSYHQKAATAYSKGEWGYSAYHSNQGKIQTKLAREADERASQDIFEARNKGFENVITIDLHGQHVKQAMRLLKLHLLFGTHVPSVRTLRVITGCGTHGMGKSKLKQSVIKLLEKEGIQWSEENCGTVLVKVDQYREFSFLDSDSDTE